jgi:hypothetical protein
MSLKKSVPSTDNKSEETNQKPAGGFFIAHINVRTIQKGKGVNEMKKSTMLISLINAALITGCATSGYTGKGGMTAYSIEPEAYEYHYKHGFTGIDAMGWDPNLQYAWSRSGAAMTCGIQFDKKLVIKNMIREYGKDELTHDMNGIMFHHLQSKKIKNFCTTERITEAKKVVSGLEVGSFPKLF